jgi:uncharacterized protein YbaP (TraB family)
LKTVIRLVVLLLITSSVHAQFEKSLLWEISGNGLKKKSYVYGTFHVSEKISYHLSDAFYQHLLEADIVSNESNPETWDILFDLALGEANFNQESHQLFSDNILKGADKQKIPGLFANMNYFSNMTSGNDGESADYRENTVLDMFIFQTAKKYNKKIVGLENAKESYLALNRYEKTRNTDEDETEENSEEAEEKRALLAKIIKGKSAYIALKDFYREKDIVMLDSLSKLTDGPKKHKILILDRNYIMVKSIDSLARQGSLFSAVGAAHLGGKEGVLQLLIDKGYTVKPVLGPLTKKGEAQKKVLEELYITPKSKPSTSQDGMIQSVSFDLDLEFGPMKSTLDIANGGVLNITRLPLNNFMMKRKDQFNPKTIDSLLYEYIPGKILEKKDISDESYVGYDVRNKSKTGNYQHFRFYVTPLEIISICMVGPNDYVKKFEQSIYDRVKIKGFGKNWATVSPSKGGFSVNLPEYCVQYGNSEKFESNITFQAYDPSEKGYYFVLEQSMTDYENLDDAVFQHGRLHNEFYMNHDLKETANFDVKTTAFESTNENESHKYRLKSVIKGNKYYLLGAVDSGDENSRKFFDSFSITPFKMQKTTVHKDTVCNYSVEIPEKVNETKILGISRSEMYRFMPKSLRENRISTSYISHSGQKVYINEEFIGRYNQLSSIDSLKSRTLRYLEFEVDDNLRDSLPDTNPLHSKWDSYFKNTKKSKVTLLDFKHDASQDAHILDALITKNDAAQVIKVRVITNKNREVMLKTLVDKDYKNDDEFIEKVYSSFRMEPNKGAGLLDDKVQLFMDEARSETDSIRKLAFDNIYSLTVKETDFERIKNFIDTFPFKDKEIEGKTALYGELSNLKNPEIEAYLEAKYKEDGVKSIEQLAILNALASHETEKAFKTILRLMEYDLPVSEDSSEIYQLFSHFRKKPEVSKVLFPDIFQFYGIDEYNKPIILFCNELLEKKLGSPKKIAAFQKIILTHSKLEYKRMVNRQEKKAANADDDDEYNEDYAVAVVDDEDEDEPQYSDLLNYISLLYHLPSNKNVDELLEKMKKIDDPNLQLSIIQLEMKHNKTTKERLQNALDNSKSKFNTVLLLTDKDEHNLLNNLKDDEIAEAAMLFFDKVGAKDKVQFLEKRTTTKNGHDLVFYFYQTQPMKDGKPSGTKVFHAMAFVVKDGKILPQVFKSPVVEDIDEENTVEKLMPIIMNETLNENRPMANYRKDGSNHNPLFDYED